MAEFDQYSRWLCKRCGKDGIDSWNKGIYDGIAWKDDNKPDNPHVVGMDCTNCLNPVTVAYCASDEKPHAIFGPVVVPVGQSCYDYEADAFASFAANPKGGEPLEPSAARDMDWRGGCLNLKQPPALQE